MNGRVDPIFKLRLPLLFAHRGGAKEQPESTKRAFRYAKEDAKADVLELDLQVTRDNKLVVWHGPKLNNVLFGGTKHAICDRNYIWEFDWKELEKATVANPRDLVTPKVSQERDTHLMLFEDFLEEFKEIALNIEMKKERFSEENVKHLLKLLIPEYNNGRKIVVVSQSLSLLDVFRRECCDQYPTGLSKWEVFQTTLRGRFSSTQLNMCRRALQTSYIKYLTSKRLIEKVHQAKGTVHVFLNVLFALDRKKERPTKDQLFALLNRGVDGIITDRPGWVRPLITEWHQQQDIAT